MTPIDEELFNIAFDPCVSDFRRSLAFARFNSRKVMQCRQLLPSHLGVCDWAANLYLGLELRRSQEAERLTQKSPAFDQNVFVERFGQKTNRPIAERLFAGAPRGQAVMKMNGNAVSPASQK